MIKLTRFSSGSRRNEWILDIVVGRLSIRFGSWQRAVWWRTAADGHRPLYNSWMR